MAIDDEAAIAPAPAVSRHQALNHARHRTTHAPACRSRRDAVLGLAAATLGCLTSSARSQPADAVEDLVVYSTTDEDVVEDLIAEFQSRMPDIRVVYKKQNSDEMYDRLVREADLDHGTADVVWSSAMDLQMKLVNDGYAQTFTPTELSQLPSWAVWKEQAYGVTAEPIVFAYNRDRIQPSDVPRSHAALREFLVRNADSVRGQVATYDPERSGTGLLFLSKDVEITPQTWDLVAALGRADAKLYTTTSSMMEGISSGRLLLAYNLIGSYVMARARRDAALGIVIPTDYVLLMTRIAFVPARARHPELGKAFLDFLLSQRGQTLLAQQFLGSVRDDVPANESPIHSTGEPDRTQPIHIGPALLANLDQARRASFIRQWRRAEQSRS